MSLKLTYSAHIARDGVSGEYILPEEFRAIQDESEKKRIYKWRFYNAQGEEVFGVEDNPLFVVFDKREDISEFNAFTLRVGAGYIPGEFIPGTDEELQNGFYMYNPETHQWGFTCFKDLAFIFNTTNKFNPNKD